MKKVVKVLFLVALTAIMFACGKEQKKNPADYVNPIIGTGGHGHTFPGVSMPFGMVQLSPDTRLDGWDGCGGYHYSDSIVYGFSHTHLSGTGCSDYGDILLMPTVGDLKWKNTEYASTFSHKNEKATVGYYSVLLDKYNVKVELTATKRAGFHKYTFPESKQSNILIDLKHRDKVLASSIKIIGKNEIEGLRRSENWAKDQYVYFVAKFSKPFESVTISENDTVIPNCMEKEGKALKCYVTFTTKKDEVVYVKVGISAVSVENARKNLDAEIKDWEFDTVKTANYNAWNKELGKIEVEGGSETQKTIFYTSMYHAFVNPNLYSDVDGQYRGRDLKIHKTDNFDMYTVFSLWDTYRAANPLYTITQPKRVSDFIKTFIRQYQEGGTLPVWELSGNETGCMIGYHSVPVIVDAYMKGIRDYDVEKAFEAIKKSADEDKLGLKSYKASGVIPANEEGESVSKLLEYAYDDWCIAQMAKALNKPEDYKRFIERAQSYKNVFDPSTGFMRARVNNFWFAPFDPTEVNFNYTEANCWQYTFYVPQDLSNFAKYLGGKDKFGDKLDQLFTVESKTTGREQADITGMIGQYAHGNEPSHHMAYLFDYAGQPWKTQSYIHKIQKEMYHADPDGLCGNEDCGQMSSWMVMSAMGIYEVTPGSNTYAIGTPMFEKLTIHLDNGKNFVINAKNVSDKNFYIHSATLNGKPYTKSYLMHDDINNGGEITFEMGSAANKQWGVGEGNEPVTNITDHLITPIPFMAKGTPTFLKEQVIEIGCLDKEATIYYTLDGKEPTDKSLVYKTAITVKETTTIKAFAKHKDLPDSKVMTATTSKIPEGRTIVIKNKYAPQYSAGGDMALIDLKRGGENFRTGTWQGYEGVDVDATIDLGKKQSVKEIATGFLQDQGGWIFFPSQVEYYISDDGKDFKQVGVIKTDVPQNKEGVIIKDYSKKLSGVSTRFIKVVGKTIGKCPPWHLGAGGKAWVFADEVVIK